MQAKLLVDLGSCDLCGACCSWLPGLLCSLRYGCILISESNTDRHATEIASAIYNCKQQAIHLERFDENSRNHTA